MDTRVFCRECYITDMKLVTRLVLGVGALIIVVALGMMLKSPSDHNICNSTKEIKDYGTYKLCSNHYLQISQGNISILDSNQKTITAHPMRFSDIMRWYAVLDEKGNIWFYSSDIGSSVFVYKDGTYVWEESFKSYNCNDLPKRFYELLPGTYKEHPEKLEGWCNSI